MSNQIKGTLEIDASRGVIYFHDNHNRTILRICRLEIPKDYDYKSLIDLTHMHGCSYSRDYTSKESK